MMGLYRTINFASDDALVSAHQSHSTFMAMKIGSPAGGDTCSMELQEATQCLLLALPGHLFRSETALLGQVLSDHRHKFPTGMDRQLHCWFSTQHYTLHNPQELSIEHLAIHCTAGLVRNINQFLH